MCTNSRDNPRYIRHTTIHAWCASMIFVEKRNIILISFNSNYYGLANNYWRLTPYKSVGSPDAHSGGAYCLSVCRHRNCPNYVRPMAISRHLLNDCTYTAMIYAATRLCSSTSNERSAYIYIYRLQSLHRVWTLHWCSALRKQNGCGLAHIHPLPLCVQIILSYGEVY